MSISEVPMCEDHPNIPAEALCITHKQFVCMTCVVEGKKHTTKKCDSRAIRNLTSEDDLKLVSLLAMKTGILEKKKRIGSHMSDTDNKTLKIKAKIEEFQREINNDVQKKVELAMKLADDKANAIQQQNQNRLEQINRVNDMFEAEIERLTSKKAKQTLEKSLSDLRANACNLPHTDLKITHEFTPDKSIKNALEQSQSLGNILFVEDDELYDTLLGEYEGGYLEPIKTTPGKTDAKLKIESFEDHSSSSKYENLEIKSKTESGLYKNLSVTEGIKEKSKPPGRKSLPLPEPPASEYTGQKTSNVKLDILPKSIDGAGKGAKVQNKYINYEQLKQSSTNSEKKPSAKPSSEGKPISRPSSAQADKSTSDAKTASGNTATPITKKAEPLKRGSSLLEKYFGDNKTVMSANAARMSSTTPQVQNKAVTLSGKAQIKRRISKITMLGTNRIVFLDELNSAILLVKTNGTVISELKGEKYMHMVKNGRDTVAVLGRGQSLQIIVYMAIGERNVEEQSRTKLESSIAEVTGFDFDQDTGEYALSGGGRVFIVSESGKTKKTMSYAKCLSGKEGTGSLKTAYDFESNSLFLLNTVENYLRRFDLGKEQAKWESKIENAKYMPGEIFKGQKMVHISYHDCIKCVAKETGAIAKTVTTGAVLSESLGVFVDEATGTGVVSSATDSKDASNKFGIIAV